MLNEVATTDVVVRDGSTVCLASRVFSHSACHVGCFDCAPSRSGRNKIARVSARDNTVIEGIIGKELRSNNGP